MTISTSHLLTGGCLIIAAVVDRFVLRRRQVELLAVEKSQDDERYCRFSMTFRTKHILQNATVSYTIRDKQNPTTVINGKTRTLDFSKVGTNSEYLLFNKKLVNPGVWVLDVKIESSGSRINPLYKIFPLINQAKKEFILE
ncbi:hypothetical protein L4174_023760 (plasmid) [Photobacterium sp. CCB-ST2H9]|uniref:hypothetical protein n=1 Tax=Photobacterium sp. CCB-ST2H9 TaxID=2912855 RepID=UPI00200347CE|nr:hypothetical protein [Photobacterium sp. CCB-ST2H9]UTM60485.1 hypothetical protein L4174_023760 [Photobacterium sp. CCB-ST2H9]